MIELMLSYLHINPSVSSPTSRPTEDRRMSAFIPELVKLEVIPCSPGYLQYDPARSSDNLCGYVDHLAANGGGIGLDGDNFSAHILLECLIEEETLALNRSSTKLAFLFRLTYHIC